MVGLALRAQCRAQLRHDPRAWTTTGTFMLMFLAGLQNVPEELDEAASIDGASARQRFRITLPLLSRRCSWC